MEPLLWGKVKLLVNNFLCLFRVRMNVRALQWQAVPSAPCCQPPHLQAQRWSEDRPAFSNFTPLLKHNTPKIEGALCFSIGPRRAGAVSSFCCPARMISLQSNMDPQAPEGLRISTSFPLNSRGGQYPENSEKLNSENVLTSNPFHSRNDLKPGRSIQILYRSRVNYSVRTTAV